MTRQIGRPCLALALVLATAGPALSAEKVESVGNGPAYRTLGRLPMMHEGRVKPLDTVAREEIKQIYTRETIKVVDSEGKVVATWDPVAAFVDWPARPKFWDAQPIIAVEYLPLKRFILAAEIKDALNNVAGKAATSADDRDRLKALVASAEVDAAGLRDAVRNSKLSLDDGRTLLKLAAKVGEETKWMAPGDLEDAGVVVDGKDVPFLRWLDELSRRGEMSGGRPKLSDLEQKGFEVGIRLGRYRAIRDREALGMVPLQAMPRPSGPAMLAYTTSVVTKIRGEGDRQLSPLEIETAGNLRRYFENLPDADRALPGTDPKFDARYSTWIKERSSWVPLGVIREAPVEDLARAGFPSAKVEAFRAAFKAMDDEELANPGHASDKVAATLIDSARDLGMVINPSGYPTDGTMAREAHFNLFAPFLKAPIAYLVGALMLTLGLVARRYDDPTNRIAGFGRMASGAYLLGMVGFTAGIALEVYGFVLRVLISGWAPVTNMYETVIWVALVLSVIGFVLEAIYRKTYAALAGSLVALLGTGLAATVPMLDPKIGQLPPVLRSNLWLSIHVLTIVSSYAAFALAWGLGLIASATYLTATYRRSAGLASLASPLLPGVPMLVSGWYAVSLWHAGTSSNAWFVAYGHWPAVGIASIGGFLTASALFALLGEAIHRITFREAGGLDDVALAGSPTIARPGPKNPIPVAFDRRESAEAGGVAVLTEPVADPRDAFAPMPRPDARAAAMRATAAQIKPMANFIYRSMQVGILLVAAGTFLGGWWADVSWGRFWGWDPKEVWALITLLVYLIPLHGRFAGWVNTFWLVMASVACFCSVLMAWYGVNFVLGVGLHSYGAGEGGQLPVLIATVVMLGFAGGAFWRRRLSSMVPGLDG